MYDKEKDRRLRTGRGELKVILEGKKGAFYQPQQLKTIEAKKILESAGPDEKYRVELPRGNKREINNIRYM